MKLERVAENGLELVLDDGARCVITGARVSTYWPALPDGSGERARWSEASAHARGATLFVCVVDVVEHDGGVDRSTQVFRSDDRGRSWSRDREVRGLGAEVPIATLSTHPSELTVLGGYRLVRRLAWSSFGEVHLALDADRDGPPEEIALKVLTALAGDVELRERFRALAQTLPSLRHPNLVAVRACIDAPTLPPLVAMDLAKGETLEHRLERGAIDPETARELARGMLLGLEAVHAHGLVHGDVRPANVFLIKDGRGRAQAALSDVALLHTIEDPGGTRGSLRRELAYQPIDGSRLERPDALSDIYSVGICLFEMLAGNRPWTNRSGLPLLVEMATSPIALEGASPELTAIVARATTRDRDARFASASAMREALEKLRGAPA